MKVSVIIPYNKDRGFLKYAVRSVRVQTHKDIELVLSHGDYSCAENINRGINRATGDYIKILAEDDWLPPDSIENSLKCKADFSHGNAWQVFRTGNVVYVPPVKEPTVEDLLHKYTLHGGTILYKREIFERLGGFDQGLETAEEMEFHLRALAAGYKIGYINKYLHYYRRHLHQKSVGKGVNQVIRNKVKQEIKRRYELKHEEHK
jgi:teichuronic acid biosynthesis glycosyltransferase TuaG